VNKWLALALMGILILVGPGSVRAVANSYWPSTATLTLEWDQVDLTLVGLMVAGVTRSSRFGLLGNLSFSEPLVPVDAFTDNTTDVWWLCIVKGTPMEYSNWSVELGANYAGSDWPDATTVNCSGQVTLDAGLIGVILITSQVKGSSAELRVASWTIDRTTAQEWGAVAVLAIVLISVGAYLISRRLFLGARSEPVHC
jgi:hypothetical protein